MSFTLAIATHGGRFNLKAVEYCRANDIAVRLVDFNSQAGLEEAKNCDAIYWHLRGDKFGEDILTAFEAAGVPVFPDHHTRWPSNNKIAQAIYYPLAAVPHPETKVFFDEREALEWAETASLPIVWKLSTGAGSLNVALFSDRGTLQRTIRKSFGRGFWTYRPLAVLRWRLYQFRLGQVPFKRVLAALYRFLVLPREARLIGKQSGYFLAQQFIAGNDGDIRVIVIGDKALGIYRRNRDGDFRASASGLIYTDPAMVGLDCVKLAFETAAKMGGQCHAFDMVRDSSGRALILETCYGFTPEGYTNCKGYWTRELQWVEGPFDPYGWIVENLRATALGRVENRIPEAARRGQRA